MKIRMKANPRVEREVLPASRLALPIGDKAFEWVAWFSQGEAGEYTYYSKDQWEEVKPKPVYRDVTAECDVYESDCITHGNIIRFVPHSATYGYRLRKIDYANRLNDPTYAFIVEKLEP